MFIYNYYDEGEYILLFAAGIIWNMQDETAEEISR